MGADTILAQEPTLAAAHGPGPVPDGPLLAVVDSANRVRQWAALRDAGHWSDVIALRGQNSVAPPKGGPENWCAARTGPISRGHSTSSPAAGPARCASTVAERSSARGSSSDWSMN